jgi:Holliday junction resolvase RusA-like endonuclease
MIEWTVAGDIPSLKNTLRCANGRFYHADDQVRAYKELFALLTPRRFKRSIAVPVGVTLYIYKKDNRKDGQNMAAMVYDALEYAGVIKNDRLCTDRHEIDRLDKKNPRVEIMLWEL